MRSAEVRNHHPSLASGNGLRAWSASCRKRYFPICLRWRRSGAVVSRSSAPAGPRRHGSRRQPRAFDRVARLPAPRAPSRCAAPVTRIGERLLGSRTERAHPDHPAASPSASRGRPGESQSRIAVGVRHLDVLFVAVHPLLKGLYLCVQSGLSHRGWEHGLNERLQRAGSARRY